jgi:hypothetical protein
MPSFSSETPCRQTDPGPALNPEFPLIPLFKFPGPLLSSCFSLWRAAFLADKSGTREAVFEHSRSFLERMLADNAITYVQDRNSREWTFNYYASNALEALLRLGERWKSVSEIIDKGRSKNRRLRLNGEAPLRTPPQRRWDMYQDAFDVAVREFAVELKRKSN